MFICNPLNTEILSCFLWRAWCSREGHRGEKAVEGRLRNVPSVMLSLDGTRKDEEEGAKLQHYKCDFARSGDSNIPHCTKKAALNVWMTGSFKLLFSCPGDKKSWSISVCLADRPAATLWQTVAPQSVCWEWAVLFDCRSCLVLVGHCLLEHNGFVIMSRRQASPSAPTQVYFQCDEPRGSQPSLLTFGLDNDLPWGPSCPLWDI